MLGSKLGFPYFGKLPFALYRVFHPDDEDPNGEDNGQLPETVVIWGIIRIRSAGPQHKDRSIWGFILGLPT